MTHTTQKRERTLIMITVFVIIGAVTYTQVLEPQLLKQKHLRKALADAQLHVVKIQRDLHRRHHVNQQYQTIAPLLLDSIEETQEISVFLRQIRDLYTNISLRPKLLKQQPMTREKGYVILAIRLDLQARINQVLQFLEAVDKDPDAIAIRRCDIKALDERDTVSVSLLVTKVVAEKADEEEVL